jgi:hypothetical protein
MLQYRESFLARCLADRSLILRIRSDPEKLWLWIMTWWRFWDEHSLTTEYKHWNSPICPKFVQISSANLLRAKHHCLIRERRIPELIWRRTKPGKSDLYSVKMGKMHSRRLVPQIWFKLPFSRCHHPWPQFQLENHIIFGTIPFRISRMPLPRLRI